MEEKKMGVGTGALLSVHTQPSQGAMTYITGDLQTPALSAILHFSRLRFILK